MIIKRQESRDLKEVVLELPWSKSIVNRLQIMFALDGQKLADTYTQENNDTKVLARALTLHSKEIDVQDAGTAARFMTAFLCLQEGTFKIKGSARMHQRLIAPLVDALISLGADISYEGEVGYLPLRINGNPSMTGGKVKIPGGISSQYISALMLIAPYLDGGLEIEIEGILVSKSYVEMTGALMNKMGASVRVNLERIIVEEDVYTFSEPSVERDWSSAAFWYQACKLAWNPIALPQLSVESIQGDRQIVKLFNLLGVSTMEDENGVYLENEHAEIKIETVDLRSYPDLFPAIACTLSCLKCDVMFYGLDHLAHKESDRVKALDKELSKIGTRIERVSDNVYRLKSNPELDKAVSFEVYDDHRLAMALSILALRLPQVEILHPEVVSKSYPQFWQHLKLFGLTLDEA